MLDKNSDKSTECVNSAWTKWNSLDVCYTKYP